MMKNLIKRHLLWDLKLPAYYAAFAALSVIVSRLTASFESAVGIFINKFFFGLAISMAVSTFINMLIRCWVRFTRTSYKDESYLYHTLPLPRSALYRSHIVSALIAVAASVVFAVLCIYFLLLGTGAMEAIKAALGTSDGLKNVIFAAALVILETLFLLVSGIVGTIIGYSFDGSRTLKSVLFAAGIYLGGGIVALLLALLWGFADPAVKALFTAGGAVLPATFWKLGAALNAYYIALTALMVWIGKKLYLKKINVD